jgi:ribonuclease T1
MSITSRMPVNLSRTAWMMVLVALALVASVVGAKGWFGDSSTIAAQQLPAEAQQTLRLVRSSGPFPYSKDGTVFGNREQLLPKQPRGYYTEYTVRTPGSKDRGARRIVVGGEPSRSNELYYTDDHYQSFRRIRE